MEQKLTHDTTRGLQDVLEIDGDLLLLPAQDPLPLEEARALEVGGLVEAKTTSIYRGVYDLIRISHEYMAERSRLGHEPDWVNQYPMSVRTYLRFTYAVTEEDPIAIVPGFPYTGLSYMVRDDGLCREVCDVFNVWRLQHIKQLGFLNAPTFNSFLRTRQSLSESTRFLHSLDVMIIATIIGRNVRLNDSYLHTLRTLALSHDAFTPAGGDSIKLVAPDELDEDRIYEQRLRSLDLRRLKKEFGVFEDVLREGIHNRGLIGEILDIADKLAYIARDIDKCLHHIEAGAAQDHLGLTTLLGLLRRYPHVCSIWDDVEVQDGHAVFTNIARLVAFLKVRLLMFRELYYHPDTRFGEFLMSRLFMRVLYQQKKLTRDALLKMSDGDLLRVLDKEYGSGAALDTCSSECSRCNVFRTTEEAQVFVDELKKRGHVFWMLDDNRRGIKTGTDFLVKGPQGPVTLKQADPGSARELEEMATVLPMVHVYWLEGDPALSQKSLAKLKSALT